MFSGALLLGSLIVFNGQKSECDTLETGNPDIEHIDLQAEVCSNKTAASSVPSYRHNSGVVYESISGNLNHLEYLNLAKHLIRIKAQMQIHLELKPVIGFQTGRNLHHRSRYDDPPIS